MALRSLGFRLRSAVGHTGFTKFIVLSRSRTGSNMLVSLLDSHPRVAAEGEIVARLDGRDARKRLASELEERFRKTKIGRAHDQTPGNNEHHVCSLLLAKK